MSLNQQYLSIRNWSKYQTKLKSGKENRSWIRTDTNRIDDPDYAMLTLFERGLYDSIREYTGRSGRWMLNDVTFISRATHAWLTDRPHIVHAVSTLISRRFLVLCNEQNIVEFATQDKTGQDKTVLPPIIPQEEKPPKQEYTERFELFWSRYPRTNGSKFKAFSSWKKSGLENGIFDEAMYMLEKYLLCPKWLAGYVHHATTWINGKMWEVEPDVSNGGSNGTREHKSFRQLEEDRGHAQLVRLAEEYSARRRARAESNSANGGLFPSKAH